MSLTVWSFTADISRAPEMGIKIAWQYQVRFDLKDAVVCGLQKLDFGDPEIHERCDVVSVLIRCTRPQVKPDIADLQSAVAGWLSDNPGRSLLGLIDDELTPASFRIHRLRPPGHLESPLWVKSASTLSYFPATETPAFLDVADIDDQHHRSNLTALKYSGALKFEPSSLMSGIDVILRPSLSG